MKPIVLASGQVYWADGSHERGERKTLKRDAKGRFVKRSVEGQSSPNGKTQ